MPSLSRGKKSIIKPPRCDPSWWGLGSFKAGRDPGFRARHLVLRIKRVYRGQCAERCCKTRVHADRSRSGLAENTLSGRRRIRTPRLPSSILTSSGPPTSSSPGRKSLLTNFSACTIERNWRTHTSRRSRAAKSPRRQCCAHRIVVTANVHRRWRRQAPELHRHRRRLTFERNSWANKTGDMPLPQKSMRRSNRYRTLRSAPFRQDTVTPLETTTRSSPTGFVRC